MFNLREELASADVVARQELMWSVIRGRDDDSVSCSAADDVVKKKTAAIYGCGGGRYRCNPVHLAKIYKSLDAILQLLATTATAAGNDDILDERNVRRVKNQIKSAAVAAVIGLDDVIQLPVRPPILAYWPRPPSTYNFTLPMRPSTGVSLHAFELLAFDNRVIYRYYEGVTFSTYLYHNLMYMLGASDVDRLDGDRRWQARLALLVNRRWNFTDTVSMAAFNREDTVRYRGVDYDTSFVPNYDVYSLTPASRICDPATAQCTKCGVELRGGDDDDVILVSVEKILGYRDSLDVRRWRVAVPPEYMSVFLTFPFKDGHYIRPVDGTVMYLDVGPPRRAIVPLTVQRISLSAAAAAAADVLEHDLTDAARTLRLDEVLAYALHAERLEYQGAALLILRHMIGNTVKVNDTDIRLPYVNEVLEWVTAASAAAETVATSSIVMPKKGGGGGSGGGNNEKVAVDTAVALIRDIGANVRSKLAATFACSSFHLAESVYRDVYDRLATDAELYVFFTLVVQQYKNANSYRLRRDRLKKPEFGGGDAIDDPMAYLAGKYRVYTRPYIASSSCVQYRLDAYVEPLVTPTDMIAAIERRPSSLEKYEFSDPQLNTLAATGNVDLTTPSQIASYITLCVS